MKIDWAWLPRMGIEFDPQRLAGHGPSVKWIAERWDLLRRVPGGTLLFSRWLGRTIPYTGSIRAHVVELGPGRSRVLMRDLPALQNHLGSIHAIALGNLAELAGNAALAYGMPSNARFIVTRLTMDYLKKAHGTIEALGHSPPIVDNERREYVVEVELRDAAGATVARAEMKTLVGPVPHATSAAG